MDKMDRTQKMQKIPRIKTIPMVCSWCGKIYGHRRCEYEDHEKTGASHGICPKCLKDQEDSINGA